MRVSHASEKRLKNTKKELSFIHKSFVKSGYNHDIRFLFQCFDFHFDSCIYVYVVLNHEFVHEPIHSSKREELGSEKVKWKLCL